MFWEVLIMQTLVHEWKMGFCLIPQVLFRVTVLWYCIVEQNNIV